MRLNGTYAQLHNLQYKSRRNHELRSASTNRIFGVDPVLASRRLIMCTNSRDRFSVVVLFAAIAVPHVVRFGDTCAPSPCGNSAPVNGAGRWLAGGVG
jgi:hypothetical protein